MATCTTSPPETQADVVAVAAPDYVQYVQSSRVARNLELGVFAFFAAMVTAALLTASDMLLQSLGIKQPAAYDFSRAALLWAAFMMAQSSWQARCT